MSPNRSTVSSEAEIENARYCFSLTLSATDLTDAIANAIYQLNIDDALVGHRGSSVYIDFDIDGTSYADAIMNAIEAVEKALPGITVTGVHPPGEDAIEEANAFLKTRKSRFRQRLQGP